VGGSDTRATVGDGLVGDGVFTEVVANHLRLDVETDVVETVVDVDFATDHLGDDDHVAKLGLDGIHSGTGDVVLLGLAKLLDEDHVLLAETAVEPATSTGMEESRELLRLERQEAGDWREKWDKG